MSEQISATVLARMTRADLLELRKRQLNVIWESGKPSRDELINDILQEQRRREK